MCIQAKFLLLFVATALLACASSISFVGPNNPITGLLCNPTDPGCIFGDPALYAIYGAQLTQPTGVGQPWVLTIETNFPPCNPGTPGCTLQHTIAPGNVIPPAPYGAFGPIFSISDFLIHWNNTDYGIVLAQHVSNGTTVDNYVAGNLYQAPNTQPDEVLAGSLIAGLPPARANEPVWLAPGGNFLGAGTVSVALGGNGTPASYTITDQFFAPAGFLSTGNFSITDSSYVCANGILLSTGTFAGGAGGGVPEPSTFLLTLPVLLLFLAFRSRLTRKTRA